MTKAALYSLGEKSLGYLRHAYFQLICPSISPSNKHFLSTYPDIVLRVNIYVFNVY